MPGFGSGTFGSGLFGVGPSADISADGPLPYVTYCGVEIGNAARTLSYLRAGLGDTSQGKWEVHEGNDVCGVLYRDSGGHSLVYTSPAADPAPWYDATEPGAASFLGLVLLDVKGYDGFATRSTTQRVGGLTGASFGRAIREGREWTFRAALISADGAGAEYGLRWLTESLGNPSCDDCSPSCALQVRLLCPPTDGSNDTLGLWNAYDTVLTKGPKEVEPYIDRKSRVDQDVLAGCRDYVIVEWTMMSGNPFLYRNPVLERSFSMSQLTGCTSICDFLFGSPGSSQCVTVTPPAQGTLGTVFMLHSNGGYGGIVIEGWEACPGEFQSGAGDALSFTRRPRTRARSNIFRRRGIPAVTPDKMVALAESIRPQHATVKIGPPAVVTPVDAPLRMEFSAIPAGKTLVVDSARRRIVTVDNVTGAQDDASNLLVFEGDTKIDWLEIANCDDITCFCIRPVSPCAQFGDLDVSVYSQRREG